MRKLAIPLLLLILTLIIGAAACSEGEARSPEAKEIQGFLNDKHVNAVLWEEWNIYDEWVYALSLYENSPQRAADTNTLWQQEKALANRARQNYQDLLGIDAPQPLQAFWDDLIAWPKQFYEWSNSPHTSFSGWLVEKADRKHAHAWLELKGICREHGISMEWPLPRVL